MKSIKLILDPRKSIPGVTCSHDSDTVAEVASRPLFSDDPFDMGRRIPLLPPSVVIPEFTLQLDSRWVLDGQRFFFNKDVGFFCDQVLKEDTRGEILSVDRNTRLSYSDGFFIDECKQKAVRKLSGRVGAAISVELSNWGSFVTRMAPKAALLLQEGCDHLLVYCPSRNHLDLLIKLGWREERIIPFDPSCNYVADTFVYPSEPTRNLYMSARAVAVMREFQQASSRRLYISRQKGIAAARRRRVLNAADVEETMVRLGFEIVYPDLLALDAQVKLFAEADFIVGPSGAGLFNAVFSPAQTKIIDIESVNNWIYGHIGLFGSLDARFGINWGAPIEGRAVHKPFLIDIDSLKNRVEEMLDW